MLIIGNSGVGKSCLLFRFAENTWSDNYVTTIGVDFKIKTMDVEGKSCKLQIWDTAGQERFRNITASYYRGASGIMIVYDVNNMESFTNLHVWQNEIEKHASKDVYKILIGNKCDEENKRQVSYEQGKEYADSFGMRFIETSAKTSLNVSDAFYSMTADIITSLNLKMKDQKKVEEKKTIGLAKNLKSKKIACCDKI